MGLLPSLLMEEKRRHSGGGGTSSFAATGSFRGQKLPQHVDTQQLSKCGSGFCWRHKRASLGLKVSVFSTRGGCFALRKSGEEEAKPELPSFVRWMCRVRTQSVTETEMRRVGRISSRLATT